MPGPELVAAIDSIASWDARPAWQVGARPDALGGLWAPRLERIAAVTPDGEPVWCGVRRSQVLRYRLALALDTQHELAYNELRDHDLAEWKRLWAAALRDLLGLDHERIADECGYSSDDERTARRAVSEGRRLWAQLAAWPWYFWCNDDGRPPRAWRSVGGGPRLDAAFETWRTDEIHVLGPRGVPEDEEAPAQRR